MAIGDEVRLTDTFEVDYRTDLGNDSDLRGTMRNAVAKDAYANDLLSKIRVPSFLDLRSVAVSDHEIDEQNRDFVVKELRVIWSVFDETYSCVFWQVLEVHLTAFLDQNELLLKYFRSLGWLKRLDK